MRFKNKGRKIYKTKEKNYYGKSPGAKVLSAVLTVFLIGGIGFIGYSLAEPVINYTKKQGDESVPTTEGTTAPEEPVTEEPQEGGAVKDDTGSQPEEQVNYELYKAVSLSVNDLISENSLELALSAIQKNEEIEYIQVPLKVRGGLIYYAASSYEAQQCGAVQSQLTLETIRSAIINKGYKPAALVSTFYDNILPSTFPGTGYVVYGTGSQWIDDDYDAGGKPGVTPYSEAANEYLKGIIDEISAAGFERIECSDFVFPEFRASDYALLDPQLSAPDRYLALTSAANLFYEQIISNNSRMILEVSASDILKGRTEVLQSMLLPTNTVIVEINIDEIKQGVSDGWTLYEFTGTPAEMTKKMLGFITDKLKGFNVGVRVTGTRITNDEMLDAEEEIKKAGLHSYVFG